MRGTRMSRAEVVAAGVVEKAEKYMTEGAWVVEDLGLEVHVLPLQDGHVRDEICLCVPIRIQDPGARPVLVHRRFRKRGGH